MNSSRTRLLIALDGGCPDRLPAVVHQWQQYHLDEYLGGISALAACARFGLDAAIQYEQPDWGYWLSAQRLAELSTSTWRHRTKVESGQVGGFSALHVVETPAGKLEFSTAGDQRTVWVTGYPLQVGDELAPLRHLPVPSLDLASARRQAAAVGEQGILRGSVWGDQPGCWQHACCLVEPAELMMGCFDQPEWVHELLGILLEKKLQWVESLAGAPFDLVETGGGSASTTVVSPNLHREFCLPYDRRLHHALTAMGFRVVYHVCGGNKGIEQMIVDNGCQVMETMAPLSVGGNQEPWEFAARVKGRIALIGGLDQVSLLTDGEPKMIAEKVHELFETVGSGGGYVIAPSDHFFAAPPVNLKAYGQAVAECVY